MIFCTNTSLKILALAMLPRDAARVMSTPAGRQAGFSPRLGTKFLSPNGKLILSSLLKRDIRGQLISMPLLRAHVQILALSIFLIISFGQRSLGQEDTLSHRIANYVIDVDFDVEAKMLDADQVIEWHNPSDNTIEYLYFHLYYNAFKNTKSTFFTERGFSNILPNDKDGECSWSWSKVISLTDEDGNELVENGEYVQPDDNNAEDQTVWRVKLITPIIGRGQGVYRVK